MSLEETVNYLAEKRDLERSDHFSFGKNTAVHSGEDVTRASILIP